MYLSKWRNWTATKVLFIPSSFCNKSHNSALVTGSDEDGLIIQPTMVEQYEL